MNQLPEDVIIVIFNKLYVEALVNISQTCKYLNNISNYDSIWENRLKPKNRHYTRNFKHEYMAHYCYKKLYKYFIVSMDNVLTNKRYAVSSIPGAISLLKDLTSVRLSNNNLSHIPKYISNLQNLIVLELAYNKFKSFPINICTLTNLKTLNLSNNEINFLPDDINTLTKLECLNLTNSHLYGISKNIMLPNLTHLYINKNNLSKIPKWIYYSKSLKYVGHNLTIPFSKIFRNNKYIANDGQIMVCDLFKIVLQLVIILTVILLSTILYYITNDDQIIVCYFFKFVLQSVIILTVGLLSTILS